MLCTYLKIEPSPIQRISVLGIRALVVFVQKRVNKLNCFENGGYCVQSTALDFTWGMIRVTLHLLDDIAWEVEKLKKRLSTQYCWYAVVGVLKECRHVLTQMRNWRALPSHPWLLNWQRRCLPRMTETDPGRSLTDMIIHAIRIVKWQIGRKVLYILMGRQSDKTEKLDEYVCNFSKIPVIR